MKRLMILLSLLLTSCVKTEVINAHIEQVDTVVLKKPHKPPVPMPPQDTTDRVSIGWNPTVEDWEETEIDIP